MSPVRYKPNFYTQFGMTFLNFKIQNSTFCSHCTYVFSTHLRTVNFVPYSIYWSVFITDMESVYCEVRNGSSDKTDYVSSLNGRWLNGSVCLG